MSIVVVSDASPIRALDHLTLLSLCAQLYGSVIVPESVRLELLQPTATCRAIDLLQFKEFIIKSSRHKPADLGIPTDLDAGETEAIALAIEWRADLILMDERRGTAAARQLGLTTVGVFGVLLDAKRNGFIERVSPCIDRLVRELHFHASPSLMQRVRALAGE